ncbi:MAG: NADH-quinone oxidoreductase subunit NuoF [Thermoplasmata archaeon]
MKITRRLDLEDIARAGLSDLNSDKPQILIGLATCGIAAGGMPLKKFAEEYLASKGSDAEIISVGCIGMCHAEPLVDIKLPGKPRVTYSDMTVEKVKKIIDGHLLGGKPVKELALAQLSEELSECVDGVIKYDEAYKGIPTFRELPFFSKQKRIVLRNCGVIDPVNLKEYISRGGYKSAFRMLQELRPEEVIDCVKKSGIRGRGGAGFPTGLKWEFCAKAPGNIKYIICNADEGDPGAYMDRAVLEGDPHSVIEGMIIGAYAMGASEGYIYVRTEYPLAIKHLKIALAQAEKYGLLGEGIFGTNFNFRIHIREGAGVFVCGEETALIHSIEGMRGEPRPRPPFPASSGLWEKPTNINNVETWANIPLIIQRGGEWFSKIGTAKSTGTKVFSLVGKINRAGLVEVPAGIQLKDIIYEIGGGCPNGRKVKAVQTGGPSGGCIPLERLDVSVDYENLKELGSIIGSGGMVVLDEDTCMVDVARFFLTFTSEESCGKCTPCRVGTKRMLELLQKICHGNGTLEDVDVLENLSVQVRDASLCALGGTAPNPVLTTLRYFRHEYLSHVIDKKCRASVCAAMFKSPCQNTCPAETNVPGYIQLINEGRHIEAYEVNRENNPFPSICGRVCEHPCETRCQRAQLDEAIAIRDLKRFCSDAYLASKKPAKISKLKPVGKKIAIVGGGPSGLSAAYFLARLGYSPTVFESAEKAGGWLRYGIPRYRLPHDVLDKEIQDIIDLGVELKTSTVVGRNVMLADLKKKYEAVYLAVGVQLDKKLGLEGEELPGVLPGLKVLRDVNSGKKVSLGKHVLIIGGGNVAVDVARTCVRLGTKVTICYRREEEDMPAYKEEIEQCKQEGVTYHFLVAPEKLITEKGKVVGAVFRKNRIGEFTKYGRRNPIPTDERVEVRADNVIIAIGQDMDEGFVKGFNCEILGKGKLIAAKGDLVTEDPKIFAGGDAVLGPASVIEAIGHGRKAARSIDMMLSGEDRFLELEKKNFKNYSMVAPENEQTMPRQHTAGADPSERTSGFDEVMMCLDRKCAKKESDRCLRCDLSAEGGE